MVGGLTALGIGESAAAGTDNSIACTLQNSLATTVIVYKSQDFPHASVHNWITNGRGMLGRPTAGYGNLIAVMVHLDRCTCHASAAYMVVIKWHALHNASLTDVLMWCPVYTALGGNLGGCTSFLLGLDGGNFAHQVKLDVVVPVKGFRRCVDYQYGFGEGG